MEAHTVIENINRLPGHLLAEVNDFVEFLMKKNGIPGHPVKPEFGSLAGKIHMADDFDEPLEDFKDYM